MFGHLPELIIVLVIALIVFGPEKLPEVAGSMGKAIRDIRSTMDMALDQQDHAVPDDFTTYYREAQLRSGELDPEEYEFEADENEPYEYEPAEFETEMSVGEALEDEAPIDESGARPAPPAA